MIRTVIFDQELKEKWKNALQLKADSGNFFSGVIGSSLALNTLVTEVPQGYYLARQKLVINNVIPLNSKSILQGQIIKQKEGKHFNYINCRSQVVIGDHVLVELDSTLVKPERYQEEKNSNEKASYYQGQKWRGFSVSEIETFARLSKDPNSIHTGANPVVQGMLILLALEDEFSLVNKNKRQLNIQYLHPIQANEEIKIVQKAGMITGVVANKKCFILNMEEMDSNETNAY